MKYIILIVVFMMYVLHFINLVEMKYVVKFLNEKNVRFYFIL